jgi:hypothetical protein
MFLTPLGFANPGLEANKFYEIKLTIKIRQYQKLVMDNGYYTYDRSEIYAEEEG